MCFNGFPVIFSLCFVSYDQQFIIFIVVLWYMTLLYTFGSFGWEFWVQLATEGVLPMRFCGPLFCQACWLFYFSKDEVIRESTAKLPAGCSSVYQVRILNFRFFFFAKLSCMVCVLHTIKPAIVSQGFILVLAILGFVSQLWISKLYLLQSLWCPIKYPLFIRTWCD